MNTLAVDQKTHRCRQEGRKTSREILVDEDRLYFEEIIPSLENRMMRAIWRVVRHPDTAEDAFQDALTIIWKKRKHIRVHPNPPAFVLRICLSAAIDALRKQSREHRRIQGMGYKWPGGEEGSAETSLEHKQLEQEIMSAIQRLPRNQALAAMMRILQDRSYTHIAQALGCREVTARIHVSRARAKLSRWLRHLNPSGEVSDETIA